MSYLAAGTYAGIRADPNSITAVFQRVEPIFARDLDMPNVAADQSALEAAFCTIVAGGMAPYGAENFHNYDLSTLLATPSLACDGYASLAWELAAEFSDDVSADMTAVGWNGGAVGNHAQLLFNDDATQMLLDPTIGLVVDDATMAGLTSGESYADTTSFYNFMAEGLDGFNAEVKNAVAQGLYKDTDAIYYVDDLARWQAEGSGFYLPTEATSNGSNGAVITTRSDWDNRRLSINYAEPDRSRYLYQYDPAGNYAWSSVETEWNSVGTETEVIYDERNGVTDFYQYGFPDLTSIETITQPNSQSRSEIIYKETSGAMTCYQFFGAHELETTISAQDIQLSSTWLT